MTKVIGLTGGIASGKSTVAAQLRQAGLVVLDADQVARAVVQKTVPPASADPGLRTSNLKDGSLNRAKLGQLVFSDPAARKQVDAITQPLIRQVFEASLAALKRLGVPLVVLDVPCCWKPATNAIAIRWWSSRLTAYPTAPFDGP